MGFVVAIGVNATWPSWYIYSLALLLPDDETNSRNCQCECKSLPAYASTCYGRYFPKVYAICMVKASLKCMVWKSHRRILCFYVFFLSGKMDTAQKMTRGVIGFAACPWATDMACFLPPTIITSIRYLVISSLFPEIVHIYKTENPSCWPIWWMCYTGW